MRTSFFLAIFLCFVKVFSAHAQGLPVITQQPQSLNVCESQPFVLTVKAEGIPLSYQWQRDNADIPGANDFRYEVAAALHSQSGMYRVIVRNASGSVTSANAAVYVRRPVRVLQHPENAVTPIGSTVNFTAEFETSEPVSYQWFRGNELLKDGGRISGATSSVLTIRNIGSADTNDSYYVTATGLCGSATSNGARIFQAVISIVIQQENEACVGEGLDFTLKVRTVTPIPEFYLKYSWFHSNQKLENGAKYNGVTTDSLIVFNATESDTGEYTVIVSDEFTGVGDTSFFKANLNFVPEFADLAYTRKDCEGMYLGRYYNLKHSGTYTIKRYHNDSLINPPVSFTDRRFLYMDTSVTIETSGKYVIIISNSCGADTVIDHLVVYPKTEIIEQPPAQVTVFENTPYTLSVKAKGYGTLMYQWYNAGIPILGATSDSYTNPSPKISDNLKEDYAVQVKGECGTVFSNAVKVKVEQTTSIEDRSINSNLQLYQNHPNPFLKETSIRYSIPTSVPVSITVRDVFGRVLKNLDLGMKDAGSYSEVIDGENWTDGMYFYTLHAGGEQLTRSFMIVK